MSDEVGYGKPPKEHRFKPGDKRINRDGRPTTAAGLSALARRIGHEVATKKNGEVIIGPDGRPVTVIEMILRQWAQNPKQQEQFVERGFGKVKDETSLTGEITLIVEYVNNRKNNPSDAP